MPRLPGAPDDVIEFRGIVGLLNEDVVVGDSESAGAARSVGERVGVGDLRIELNGVAWRTAGEERTFAGLAVADISDHH
jgi:hypothetical protein